MHTKGKIKDESFKSSSMKVLLFPPCTPATGRGHLLECLQPSWSVLLGISTGQTNQSPVWALPLDQPCNPGEIV